MIEELVRCRCNPGVCLFACEHIILFHMHIFTCVHIFTHALFSN